MKTMYKVLISFIVGVCFIVVGVSIGGLNQIKMTQFPIFNHNNIEWISNKKEDIQYTAQSPVHELKLDTTIADIEIHEKSDVQDISVNIKNVYNGLKVYQEDDKLIITQPAYWQISGNSRKAKISMLVPKGFQFQEVDINTNTGKTYIENIYTKDLSIENNMGKLTMKNIVCHNMEVDTGMSQTDLNQVVCYQNLDVDLGMGKVNILLNQHKQDYSYSVDVGMGSVQIGNEEFSGFMEKTSHHNDSHHNDLGHCQIDVDCGMGSVKIEMEE